MPQETKENTIVIAVIQTPTLIGFDPMNVCDFLSELCVVMMICGCSVCMMPASLVNIVFFQLSVECSLTDAKIQRCVAPFSFVFLQCFYDQFFFLVHDIKR